MPFYSNRHGQVIHAVGDLARVLSARGYTECPDPVVEVEVRAHAELTEVEQASAALVVTEEAPRPRPRRPRKPKDT